MTPARSHRLLIVDDNPAIHEDFRKILAPVSQAAANLEAKEADLFGQTESGSPPLTFAIDSAYQGQEAVALVERALQEDWPYALAFVDVRMPPGLDGVETLTRLWKIQPELQAVICTAFSDYSWHDIVRLLGQSDNLLILKKPFDKLEALQMAHALSKKWELTRLARLRSERLEQMAEERAWELVLANQSTSEFLNNISHELLTPMHGVLGMAELLSATQLDEDQKDYLASLRECGEGLARMLKNILDFNKLERGQLQLENTVFDVRDVCREVLETLGVKLRAKNLTARTLVQPEVPAQIQGDVRRLRQVLAELTANAIKFTDRGEILIGAQWVSESATHVTLRFFVRDTDVGMSAEVKQRLLVVCSQGDGSLTRKRGGIGMGLTLARQLIAKFKGSLEFESEEGRGTSFGFTVVLEKIRDSSPPCLAGTAAAASY